MPARRCPPPPPPSPAPLARRSFLTGPPLLSPSTTCRSFSYSDPPLRPDGRLAPTSDADYCLVTVISRL